MASHTSRARPESPVCARIAAYASCTGSSSGNAAAKGCNCASAGAARTESSVCCALALRHHRHGAVLLPFRNSVACDGGQYDARGHDPGLCIGVSWHATQEPMIGLCRVRDVVGLRSGHVAGDAGIVRLAGQTLWAGAHKPPRRRRGTAGIGDGQHFTCSSAGGLRCGSWQEVHPKRPWLAVQQRLVSSCST